MKTLAAIGAIVLLSSSALVLAGCAASAELSEAELQSAVDCLRATDAIDVRIEDGSVVYTIPESLKDVQTTVAAIAACKPNATPESVFKAVNE